MQTMDFNRMQAQAIYNAREMHKRATPPRFVEPRPPIPEPPPPPVNDNSGNTQFKKSTFPSAQEVFGHHNPWTQTRQTPFCNTACPIKNIFGIGSPQGGNDSTLLMAVMLLLSDSGDRMLMLALLYIMT